MSEQCSFCCDEIKNQDFSVHRQCNSYFHIDCFTYVKNDPKLCLRCHPTSSLRDIKDLEAKVASLKKKDEIIPPQKLASGKGKNKIELPPKLSRGKDKSYDSTKIKHLEAEVAKANRRIMDNAKPSPKVLPPRVRGNDHDRNKDGRAQAIQQNHEVKRNQPLKAQVRQQHQNNHKCQQFPKVQANQHRFGNANTISSQTRTLTTTSQTSTLTASSRAYTLTTLSQQQRYNTM